MKIVLNENNYIIAWVTVGDIEGAVEVKENENIFNSLPCTVFYYENDKIILDENKKAEYLKNAANEETKEDIQEKINDINLWFIEYDEKYTEYERCKRFNLEFSEDIDELNKKAEKKQKQLNELKKQLKALV